MRRFPIIILIASIVLQQGCQIRSSSPRRTAALLDDVESYINERPDSALAVLRALGPDSLRGPGQRARAALLHQMALDKCYIDITSDSILAPAFWYLKHGNADQKLKTWYYRSVLAANSEDVDAQMACLVRGEQFIPEAKDPLMAGRLFTSKRVLFLGLYDLEDASDNAEKAANAFFLANDRPRYYDATISLANIYNLQERYQDSGRFLDTLRCHWSELSVRQKGKAFGVELKYRIEQGPADQNLMPFISDYLAEVPPSQVVWVPVARAYLQAGYPELALSMLDRDNTARSHVDEIAYQNARYRILEAMDRHKEALEVQRRYTKLTEQQIEVGLSSKARFTAIEEEYRREMMNKRNWLLGLILGCLAIGTLLVLEYRQSRKKIRQQKEDSLVMQDRLTKQTNRVRTLTREKHAAWDEVKRLQALLQQQSLPQGIKDLITERISMLNEYGVRVLSGKDMQASLSLKERLQLEDRQVFIQHLYEQFRLLNPQLALSFEQRRLTEQEKLCCALLCLGLSSAEIARFLNLSEKRCYNIFNAIRLKMGWKGDDRTLKVILFEKTTASS